MLVEVRRFQAGSEKRKAVSAKNDSQGQVSVDAKRGCVENVSVFPLVRESNVQSLERNAVIPVPEAEEDDNELSDWSALNVWDFSPLKVTSI